MDDMVYNHGTISEKLEKESKQSHTAYEVGDFFVQALALADSRYVTLFDHNLIELQKETYPPTMNPTETIDDFCEKFDFVGVESLKNRTAPMLDSQIFYFNYLEVRDKDNFSKFTEQEYQNDGASQFAIYRLKDNDKNENLKEESLEILQSMGIELDKANYDCIYSNHLENLMSNYIEVKDNVPEDFISELEDAVYNNLDYDGYFVANCNTLLDSDVVAVQHEGYTDFFYNDVDGLKEVDFEVQPQKYIYKSQETVAPDVAQNQVQTHAANPFADMNLSDKIRHEDKVRTTSYDVGDFYLDAQTLGNEHHVTLYDRNFSDVAKEIHTDPAVTTTQAINDFCEKYDFEGADKLKNRSATMLDPQKFHPDLAQFQENAKTSKELESAYFENDSPQYAIYRMNDTEKHDHSQAESYPAMEQLGIAVDKKDYQCIAQGSLEELVPNYQGELTENPMDLRDTVQAMVMDFSNQGEDFEQKYGMPNTGDVFVFQHEGKEEAYFMDFEDSHKIDFVEQTPKVNLKSVEKEVLEVPKEEIQAPEQEGMKLDYYQKSDKLSYEKNSTDVTYQVGDFFVSVHAEVNGADVKLYDGNLETVRNFPYASAENNTEAINLFCEQVQIDGIDTLRNRSADLLDNAMFQENYALADKRRENSLDLEQKWIENPEDSFVLYALNDTEHNEQLKGRDMAFLETIGKDLHKGDFHAVYTGDLADLKDNDPLFYDNTNMEEHYQEALAQLKDGNGEPLATMFYVKSPQIEELTTELQTGSILGLKVDGQIKEYFLEEETLKEVDFSYITPPYTDKLVEENKEALAEIQSFFEEPIPTTDLKQFNQLVSDTALYSEENSREMVFEYLISEIADGKIEMSDLKYLAPEEVDKAVNSHMGILVDREVQLENVVRRNKEEAVVEQAAEVQTSPPQIQEPDKEVGNLDGLFSQDFAKMFKENPNLAYIMAEGKDFLEIQNEVDAPLNTQEMRSINQLSDSFLMMAQYEKSQATEFIAEGINSGEIDPKYLGELNINDFELAFQERDMEMLVGFVDKIKTISEMTLNFNPEDLEVLQNSLVEDVSDVFLEDIQSLITKTSLRFEEYPQEEIRDFLCETLNRKLVLPESVWTLEPSDVNTALHFGEHKQLQSAVLRRGEETLEKVEQYGNEPLTQNPLDNLTTEKLMKMMAENPELSAVVEEIGQLQQTQEHFVEELSTEDLQRINSLIEGAMEQSGEITKGEVLNFLSNAMYQGDILPQELYELNVTDILSQMSTPQTQLETSLKENNIESLLGMFQESSAMKNVAETALEVYALQELLVNPISIPEMEQINSYVTEIWLKSDDIARENIVDFIAFAINDGAIQGSDLNQIPRWDFVNALLNDDTDKLGDVAKANIKEESILKQEDVAQEVAYQVGETSIYFKVDEKEVTFGVFDQNLDQVELGTYENMTLTEGINQFASSHDLPDMDKLAKRDVESLDVDTLVYETSIRYNEKEEMAQEPQEIVEILEESQATKETQGESKGSEEKTNDIVLVQGEDDIFEATLTTQERVIIQSATDFAYDHLSDFDREQKDVMIDILGKIDPQSDLLQYYPDDYIFEAKPELSKQTTILFTEEELEMIGEVCDATKLSWDDISNEYYDLMDAIIEKVENPQREGSEEILHNVGNLAEEPKENAPRMVAGTYEIVDAKVIGDDEVAVGESPSGMAGTWERSISADESKGLVDNWSNGHYFQNLDEAQVDFAQRIESLEPQTEKSVSKEEVEVEGTKDEKVESKSEKAPRESVLGKLKEIKEQIGKQEQKEQPSKDKDKDKPTL